MIEDCKFKLSSEPAMMFIPVSEIEPMPSVLLGERVTHKVTVVDKTNDASLPRN